MGRDDLKLPVSEGGGLSSSQDVETVRGAHEAWNGGDLEALRAFYTEDVTASAGTLWPAAGEVSGREAVLAQFASIFETFEDSVVVAEEFVERAGGVVVVPSRWRGKLRGSDGMIEQRLVAVYHLRDGRIAHIGYFADLDQALAALEAGPARRP
jgi:ketosteroid isomerase-like protein